MTNKSFFKIIIVLLIFFTLPINNNWAQTYISPILGYDFQKVISSQGGIIIKFEKKGYSHINPFIGIKVEHKLYKSVLFNYMSKFAYNKKIHGNFLGSCCYHDLIFKYHYFENSIGIGYLWRNRVYVNFARSYSLILNMKIININDNFNEESPPNKINEKGLKISTGFKYKKLDLGMYYYKRTFTNSYNNTYYQFLDGISSFGFELSYNFKILNGIKIKKKDECPDFKTKK